MLLYSEPPAFDIWDQGFPVVVRFDARVALRIQDFRACQLKRHDGKRKEKDKGMDFWNVIGRDK